MFFAEDGGDPERRADWRMGMLAALIANKPTGWGDKPLRLQPQDFMLQRPEEQAPHAEEFSYAPTLQDVAEIHALADRLEAAQGRNGHMDMTE